MKGTAIRTTLSAIAETYGPDAVIKVRAALPDDVKDELEGGVLASRGYPVRVPAAIQEAIRVELGGGRLDANRKIAATAGRIDFGGVYKIFVRAASYELLLRSMERAFRQYNSKGRVCWHRIETGLGEGTIDQVAGYTEPMWSAVAGRVEALLLLAGAKDATVTVTRWAGDGCDMRLRWKP